MYKRRVVSLKNVPDTYRPDDCFYCMCTDHQERRAAVVAIEGTEVVTGIPEKWYYGACAHHAEIYPCTEEQRSTTSMFCGYCMMDKEKRSTPAKV